MDTSTARSSRRRHWLALAVAPAALALGLTACGGGDSGDGGDSGGDSSSAESSAPAQSSSAASSSAPSGSVEAKLKDSLGSDYQVYGKDQFSQALQQANEMEIEGGDKCPVTAYGMAAVYNKAGEGSDLAGAQHPKKGVGISVVKFKSASEAHKIIEQAKKESDSKDCSDFSAKGEQEGQEAKIKIESTDEDLGLDDALGFNAVTEGQKQPNVVAVKDEYALMIVGETDEVKDDARQVVDDL